MSARPPLPTHEITRLGIGFVPQGRRLWPSLTVDETLRLSLRKGPGGTGWNIARIYETFPRLAERRGNGGGQLSGGEQQMLAISRALLSNPRLLVMDEPTEGLAPVIVSHVRDLLLRLEREEGLSVLVVEQNIGVATSVSEQVAIMVNGRVNRVMAAGELAADRDLQQRLLGVGRHGEEAPVVFAVADAVPAMAAVYQVQRQGDADGGSADAVYRADALPTRWGLQLVPARAELPKKPEEEARKIFAIPFAERIGRTALVVGTFDTKAAELNFIRDK